MRLLALPLAAPLALAACYDPQVRQDPADARADSAPAPNDDPANPILLDGLTGSVGVEVTTIADDSGATLCSTAGMREVYFQIQVGTAEVVFFDTGASTLPTTLEIANGACPGTSFLDCGRACGQSSQLAVELENETVCLSVEVPAEGSGEVVLQWMRSGWRQDSGAAIVASETRTVNTCGLSDGVDPPPGCDGGSGGSDEEIPVLLCPGSWHIRASTCTIPSDGDSVLYLRRTSPVGEDLVCDDDSCDDFQATIDSDVDGPAMLWLIVDTYDEGLGDECGVFQLDVTITSR